MKRNLITIILSVMALVAVACPKPTSHAIIRVGAAYEHNLPATIGSFTTDNLGVSASIGWESPNRWSTISVETTCINFKNGTNWSLGGEYALNPFGIMIPSAVNFHVLLGCGYNSIGSVYTSAGLEIDLGETTLPFVPYFSTRFVNNFGLNEKESNWGVNFNIGIRISIGKDW